MRDKSPMFCSHRATIMQLLTGDKKLWQMSLSFKRFKPPSRRGYFYIISTFVSRRHWSWVQRGRGDWGGEGWAGQDREPHRWLRVQALQGVLRRRIRAGAAQVRGFLHLSLFLLCCMRYLRERFVILHKRRGRSNEFFRSSARTKRKRGSWYLCRQSLVTSQRFSGNQSTQEQNIGRKCFALFFHGWKSTLTKF